MKTKKNIKKIWPLFLCSGMLAGCSTNTAVLNTAPSAAVEASQEIATDIDWKNAEHTTIRLEDGAAEIDKSGIFELTGSLKDGSVAINVDKAKDNGTVYLVLNNAAIESKTSAPIYIKEAEKVVIFLEDGTVNTVTQGAETITDESGDPSSAVFSKANLIIAGTGSLKVVSKYNDGITSKDDLIISGGIIQVSAVGDGITGKDMLTVETADITINAGKDGMRSTNTEDTAKGNITITDGIFHITAANDAIQAEQIIQIDGGTFDLNSGDGYPGQSIKTNDSFGGRPGAGNLERTAPPDAAAKTPAVNETAAAETITAELTTAETTKAENEESKKSIKAGTELIVNSGTFTVSSCEDALHSNGTISINGGTFSIEAGDDAIHADAAVLITSGEITISNSYEGVEGGNITIKDGTLTLTSSNDGINVSSQTGELIIDGGDISIKSGGDGIDSNGNIVMNGGTVVIDTSTTGQGDTPVDCDGTCTVNGGTITDQNGTAIDCQNQQRGGHGGRPAMGDSGNTSGERPVQPDGESMSGNRPQRGKGGRIDESGS